MHVSESDMAAIAPIGHAEMCAVDVDRIIVRPAEATVGYVDKSAAARHLKEVGEAGTGTAGSTIRFAVETAICKVGRSLGDNAEIAHKAEAKI